jgi:hypothetical protein
MALPRSPVHYRFLMPGRRIEWGVAALLLAVIVVVFMRYMREVQAQGEYATVRTTLGSLRTALVLDHLQRTANSAIASERPVPNALRNPFDLLDRLPINYRGIARVGQASRVPAGSWVFDPACPCIGYRPQDDGWLDSPSGDPVAWYVLGGAPGPLQLTARERYRWRDHQLD